MEMYISDGTTFVTLASGLTDAIAIEKYIPKPPTEKPTLTESCQILIEGKDLVKSTARTLGRLLQQTTRYQQSRMGSRVYLYFRPDDWEEWQRSELLNGRIEWNEKALDEQWAGGLIEAVILWERRAWWEGEEQELQLSNPNSNDIPTLGGINCDNPTDNVLAPGLINITNYIHIDGADVAGDLPAPVRLEFTNLYNNSNVDGLFWIGQNLRSAPETWQHIWEAEDAATSGAVVGSDTSCSRTERVDISLSSASEAALLTWTLSSEQLTAAGGNWFRALLRFSEAANTPNILDVKYRLQLKKNGVVIWQGEQVRPDPAFGTNIRDLGPIQLPPFGVDGGDSVALDLVLTGQRLTEVTETLSLDFLQLTPVDSWLELRRVGDGVAYNGRLVVDGVNEVIYADTGDGTARQANWVAAGSDMPQVWPGQASRIYFLIHSQTANISSVLRRHRVKAFYRPRRATL